MKYPRQVPLFDPKATPSSWNEHMAFGEYAVHYSSFSSVPTSGPFCTLFANLQDAEAFAQLQVTATPTLRCTIYDHRGIVGAPIRDICGSNYTGDSDLTPRFRRWVGSVLLFGGLALFIFDWIGDFRLSWPSLIGVRMLIPGLVLAVTEVVLFTHARIARRRVSGPEAM
jgi:hypothetical protein